MSEPQVKYIRHEDMYKPQSPLFATYPMVEYYHYSDAMEENARLKAEVERLYRHGDLMLKFAAANMPYPAYATFAKDWLDVKESRLK